jgi:hypothetical protein
MSAIGHPLVTTGNGGERLQKIFPEMVRFSLGEMICHASKQGAGGGQSFTLLVKQLLDMDGISGESGRCGR